MSSSPDERALGYRHQDVRAAEVEALANNLIALVEEFGTAISEGRVPPAFEERLAQLRRTAEDLIDPQRVVADFQSRPVVVDSRGR